MPRRVGEEDPGCAKSDKKATSVRIPDRSDDCGNVYGAQSPEEANGIW
jgi:hypothetical protein